MAYAMPKSLWVNVYHKKKRELGGIPNDFISLMLDEKIPAKDNPAKCFVRLPEGCEQNPHPKNPLPYSYSADGEGDERELHLSMDLTASFDEYYSLWRRELHSGGPSVLTVADTYELKQGSGVVSLLNTWYPVREEDRMITIEGRESVCMFRIPQGARLEETLRTVRGETLHQIGLHLDGTAGAMDARYSLTISNDSDAGGIALYRGKTGERIENLAGKESRFWFCGNLMNYINKEEELPFDSHYLAALIAPRHLYVASADQDDWADPRSEFLACAAASEAYESYGVSGLVTPDRYPEPGECLHEGRIGYHLRKGTHYLGRFDWHRFMEYRKKHDI